MSERKSACGERHEFNPRIFSSVYSHIAQHRGTADTGVLVDLISAISLDRSASYFEVLERLEPSTRDLGLELLRAKLYGAFPPEAWEDAHQFAKELNQRSGETIRHDSAVRARGQDSPPALRIGQPKREALPSDGSLRVVSKSAATRARDPITATTAKSADLESRIGRGSEQRARRPFRRRARTALAYVSVYGGFDGFKYLWGAAAAVTVIGLFVLVVAVDERVFDRRFEALASWLSEPAESPSQIQEPMTAGVDTTQFAAPPPMQGQEPVTAGIDTTQLAAPTAVLTPEGAPDVLSEQSALPAEEPRPIAEEPSAVEDDKIAITPPPPANATESAVSENFLLPQDMPFSTPRQEPIVEQPAPAVIASEPPKPAKRAAPKKAKSGSKARSKPAKKSLAKRPVPPTNPSAVETVEPVASQPKSKMPEGPPVAEPLAAPALENSTSPSAAVEPADEAASVSVETPRSDLVTAPSPAEAVRDAPSREKVVADPSFVERLMGFKPGERIAPIKPGRRANQPDFIRQLEGVDSPPKDGSGAEAAAK